MGFARHDHNRGGTPGVLFERGDLQTNPGQQPGIPVSAAWVSHTQRINYSIHRLSESQVLHLDGNFWATTRSG